ncbi:antibiotic biosynthesis monooxygenase [Stakelama sp. CBK3Z-3]|uniref:Antibiotic biosynthesis monooxygenase n=1 Tax=Stakelama flava TaxID=2860338 RepID=A0ABS6XMM5_9SPHN|nr:antibiotic biosynthesis monooxygenase [Stakelama flava]MBW4331452.1 antibiotic biosynthesis monooxygenase [Stakelama flava]
MLLIDTTYQLAPKDVDAFRALALKMASAARKRDGCAFLKVAQSLEDSTIFHLFEGWRDWQAVEAHGASEQFQQVLAEAGKLTITNRTAELYTVSESRPLDMPS